MATFPRVVGSWNGSQPVPPETIVLAHPSQKEEFEWVLAKSGNYAPAEVLVPHIEKVDALWLFALLAKQERSSSLATEVLKQIEGVRARTVTVRFADSFGNVEFKRYIEQSEALPACVVHPSKYLTLLAVEDLNS